MKNPPESSILISKPPGKGTRDALSANEKSKPILGFASILLSPSAFLTFIAMVGPSYFMSKIFELGGRQTVKYPGTINSFVKDQSQFAGTVTGMIEFLAKKGINKFKNFVSMANECIPAGERPNLDPKEVEKLYNGILRYNDAGEMVPAPSVKPLSFANISAQDQKQNGSTQLNF